MSEHHGKVPCNVSLLEFIRGKREWAWRPSIEELRAGFRGWHQRGYLPHFDAPGVTQFVTFMLADSFPACRRVEWEPIFREPDVSDKRRQLEAWLDRGHGPCWLRRPEIARIVEEALLCANDKTYELKAWVVMPNHVHSVVEIWDVPLARTRAHWKGQSSRGANLLLKRQGPFWGADYFDTLIRDERHLSRAIRYTEQNPGKAFLVGSPRDWRWSSAWLRDENERLRLPGRLKERGL